MTSFNFASTPILHFGPGRISVLHATIKSFGRRVLLVTGARSFISSPVGITIMEELLSTTELQHSTIGHEPSPVMIDDTVRKISNKPVDVVVAIGGGSVLDAGKAISAMLPLNGPVKDYLEGVGTKTHSGVKLPFIAIPTTAGTGSEATKNAVLSETGEHGYKKSLRHNNFVPDIAIIDPALAIHCPKSTTASSGMDAFTQLLESYLSTSSNPVTDALAHEGLKKVAGALTKAYSDAYDIDARSDMALAAYLSGITLANAGLGLVHGFASSIGGFFEIPHGIICSCMMTAANKITVRQLRSGNRDSIALRKYAAIGKEFAGSHDRPEDYYVDFLLNLMESWSTMMHIPRLSETGVKSSDITKIADVTENKNNPVQLNREQIIEVLEMAL